MKQLFIEAESFRKLGGWLIETQSVLPMGSAYIMAHGMGIPVEDAVTVCTIPEAGNWTFWVRTRDWTKVWGRGQSAGRFTLNVNGTPLPTVLGTNDSAWSWQKAGTLALDAGDIKLALHDLTGFNGRCDAIYITDGEEIPTNDPAELAELRRTLLGMEIEDYPEEFDLIVAGGGMAGVCTAISAIRHGVKTLLIQDRSVLGGCNSSEIRVSLGGCPHSKPYPNIGNVVQEIGPIMGSGGTYDYEYYEDHRKKMVFELHDKRLWKMEMNTAVVDLERDGNTIKSVLCRSMITGKETRYRAKLFADCTGDGILARMMGAETMYGTESRSQFGEELAPIEGSNQVMGQSVLWLSRDTGMPSDFPDVDFGLEFDDDSVLYVTGGDWEWESGQYRDQSIEAEYIRDYAMMAIYVNWAYLKHHSPRKAEWANRELTWVSPIGGKRESYRVVGDHVLTEQDIENPVDYPDASAAITWNIDIHYPDPLFVDKFPEPFRSCAYHRGIGSPYAIPYRCLYARDVANLFLGGRIISTTHVAFASVRVMRTLGQLGEVVGMAADICKKHDALPRDVYTDYLDELIAHMERGVPVPWYHGWMPGDRHQTYHFKELGHIPIPEAYPRILKDETLRGRIEALDVTHVDGYKMKDITPEMLENF
ncbi:MAG: FAD-dependent oxidoreductase [Clostridia bacterium]|nr:FAD-dependent oxidoreductase [Clostridia bacterium]